MKNNKIGIDITDNKRFLTYINDEKKYSKILSKDEINVYKRFTSDKRKVEYIASRFACKEALYKAINIKFSLPDVSVLNYEDGTPYIKQNFCNKTISVSISHETDYSIAMVLIEDK